MMRRPANLNREPRATAKILEKHIEQTVTQFLELDGWRSFKMEQNFSERKQKRTGEPGMPDRLYIRYDMFAFKFKDLDPARSRADVLWIEFKAPGELPRASQISWHFAECNRGALVLVVDDIDKFMAWYRANALHRNPNR